MNEWIFLLQTCLIIGFSFGALKLGKEALCAWVAIQSLIANLFVLKQTTLFGLEVTASDAFAIGSLLGINFLQEYFGQEDAKRATWICFFSLFFFAIVSQLHLLYEPSQTDESQTAFHIILIQSPRLLIASLAVFFIVQQADIKFFALLKMRFPKLGFILRTCAALVFSQFLDTVLFSFAGLYGIASSIANIIAMSFMIKLIVIFLFTSCARWAKT